MSGVIIRCGNNSGMDDEKDYLFNRLSGGGFEQLCTALYAALPGIHAFYLLDNLWRRYLP
ncbi:hypothetical protein [Yersinia entomophaga]|uniref:hypothetical protein n=1 Tax=Yersinia entomophaga TaxID=935293 RepID=UPI001008579F|nr:hypothetical protein [Yersinia entomophaga]